MPSLPAHQWLSLVLRIASRPPARIFKALPDPITADSSDPVFQCSASLMLFQPLACSFVPKAPPAHFFPRMCAQGLDFCLGYCPQTPWAGSFFDCIQMPLSQTYATAWAKMAVCLISHLTTALELRFLHCTDLSPKSSYLFIVVAPHPQM